MNKTMRRTLALCLAAACLIGASPARGGNETTWEGLQKRLKACGAAEKQCAQLQVNMQKRGLDATAAAGLLQPVFEAADEKLPIRLMLGKVMEGVAKGASAEQIAQAGEHRRECLRQTTLLMQQHKVQYAEKERARIMEGATLAMESGLSPDAVGGVMQMWQRKSANQLESVIEAGEMLHLNGLGDTVVREMMCDYLERDLRQTEIRRAMRSVLNLHQRGVHDDQIGPALWGPGAGARYGHTDKADTPGPNVGNRDRADGLAAPPRDTSPPGFMPGGVPPAGGTPGPGDGFAPGGAPDAGGGSPPEDSPGGPADGTPGSGPGPGEPGHGQGH